MISQGISVLLLSSAAQADYACLASQLVDRTILPKSMHPMAQNAGESVKDRHFKTCKILLMPVKA